MTKTDLSSELQHPRPEDDSEIIQLFHQVQNWRIASHWPRRSYLELGPLPSAVPCARFHARQVLWELGIEQLADSVELVVSELITNAVKASAPLDDLAPIRLMLASNESFVLIQAWDKSPGAPIPKGLGRDRIPALGGEDGRGLFLVESLSEKWGCFITEERNGKIVWALITDA